RLISHVRTGGTLPNFLRKSIWKSSRVAPNNNSEINLERTPNNPPNTAPDPAPPNRTRRHATPCDAAARRPTRPHRTHRRTPAFRLELSRLWFRLELSKLDRAGGGW